LIVIDWLLEYRAMPSATEAMQTLRKAEVRAMAQQAMKSKYKSSSDMSDLVLTWGKHCGKTFSDALLADMDYALWVTELKDPTGDQIFYRFYLEKLKEEAGSDAMTAASSDWEPVEQRAHAPVTPIDVEGRILRLEAECAAINETLEKLTLS
jgi:hypothetical protein